MTLWELCFFISLVGLLFALSAGLLYACSPRERWAVAGLLLACIQSAAVIYAIAYLYAWWSFLFIPGAWLQGWICWRIMKPERRRSEFETRVGGWRS